MNKLAKKQNKMRPLLRGVFRILILRVLNVNRIFPLLVLTAGAISLFLNIMGAIAPVLNTPLLQYWTPDLAVPGLTYWMKEYEESTGACICLYNTFSGPCRLFIVLIVFLKIKLFFFKLNPIYLQIWKMSHQKKLMLSLMIWMWMLPLKKKVWIHF